MIENSSIIKLSKFRIYSIQYFYVYLNKIKGFQKIGTATNHIDICNQKHHFLYTIKRHKMTIKILCFIFLKSSYNVHDNVTLASSSKISVQLPQILKGATPHRNLTKKQLLWENGIGIVQLKMFQCQIWSPIDYTNMSITGMLV